MLEPGTLYYWRVVSEDTHGAHTHSPVWSFTTLQPVSNVLLRQAPAGDVFVGNTVRFVVEAQGAVPLTYSWTLNGASAGANANRFDHTLAAAGTHTVAVTVTNAVGAVSTSRTLEVRESAQEGQPDLSRSFQIASPTIVQRGDTLTFTSVLHNDSPVVAEAVLVHPIPASTAYVPGSAQASDGSRLTFEDGAVRWQGRIVEGVPVIVEYQVQLPEVEAQTLQAGARVSEVGYLRDDWGHEVLLEADALFEPAAGLVADGGALYTNSPTVTLTIASTDELSQMQLCNHGVFGSDIGWVDADTTSWTMDFTSPSGTPQGVYAIFRAVDGGEYGPVYEHIIYDSIPPHIVELELLSGEQNVWAMSEPRPHIRAVVTDDDSGVASVQISDSAGFEDYTSYPVTGRELVVAIPIGIDLKSGIFVRAVDRAGNISPIVSWETHAIYLPFIGVSQQGGSSSHRLDLPGERSVWPRLVDAVPV